MWRRRRSRGSVRIGDRSIADALLVFPNRLETGRLAGSKIDLVVTIATGTHLIPSSLIIALEFGMSLDRGATELVARGAERPSLGVSSILLLMVVAQVKDCLYGPRGG